MKNNKTLFVAQQVKRKGFLLFLTLFFLGHLLYFLHILLTPEQELVQFSPIPSVLLDSVASPKKASDIPEVKKLVFKRSPAPKEVKKPMNSALAADLVKVYGIGPVLSKRIVNYRNSLGGFIHMDQLYQVYGLDSLVVKSIKELFEVQQRPTVQTISVNTATAYELSRVPFISKKMSEELVRYRAREGLFNNFQEILNIINLPADKIDIIELYLVL